MQPLPDQIKTLCVTAKGILWYILSRHTNVRSLFPLQLSWVQTYACACCSSGMSQPYDPALRSDPSLCSFVCSCQTRRCSTGRIVKRRLQGRDAIYHFQESNCVPIVQLRHKIHDVLANDIPERWSSPGCASLTWFYKDNIKTQQRLPVAKEHTYV